MPTKLLSKNERDSLEREVSKNKRMLRDWGDGLANPAKLQQRTQKMEQQLEDGSPKKLNPSQWRALAKRQRKLRQAMVYGSGPIPPMPSRRQMQDNPVGSTAQHNRWSRAWHNKTVDQHGQIVNADGKYGAVFEWKDNQKRLFPDHAEDTDLSNVEQFRPDAAAEHGGINEPLMNMKCASSYSPYGRLSDEQYDALFGTETAELMKKAKVPNFEDIYKVKRD